MPGIKKFNINWNAIVPPIIFILGISGLIWLTVNIEGSEVSTQTYKYVTELVDNHPELWNTLDELMVDDKLTSCEVSKLKKEAYKIERQKVKDAM